MGSRSTTTWLAPTGTFTLVVTADSPSCGGPWTREVTLSDAVESINLLVGPQPAGWPFYIVFASMCQVTPGTEEIYMSSSPDIIDKDTSDTMPTIRVIAVQCNVTVVGPLGEEEETEEVYTVGTQGGEDWEGRKVEGTGEFLVMVDCGEVWNTTREVEQGANYNLVVAREGEGLSTPVVLWFPVTEPNSIHIFWILPQVQT